MTRPQRRDKNTKNGSVITGLRLERDCAQLLCAQAIKRVPDRYGRGDVAEMARYFLRRGLGDTHDQANMREEHEPVGDSGLAGLSLDAYTKARLGVYADDQGFSRAGAARHLLRVGLGYGVKISREREDMFATIAEIRRAEHGR